MAEQRRERSASLLDPMSMDRPSYAINATEQGIDTHHGKCPTIVATYVDTTHAMVMPCLIPTVLV